jgi:uncharacterized protein YbjT (DUF2867 family)
MKIAVIGGTGLIGTRVVAALTALGHDVVTASRATGVNSYTGDGLADALEGVHTIVDVSNSSYLDEAGAIEFFYGSTLNLLSYGAAAGVRHHVALSVVGTDRLARTEGGYFAAKKAQERLIEESTTPFTIVHATQFFEFLANIADAATAGHVVRLSEAFIQPMAADDVAASVAAIATAEPRNAIVEFAGPERFRLGEIVERELTLRGDPREVVADPLARYFGTRLDEDELLPGSHVTLTETRFGDWLTAARVASP